MDIQAIIRIRTRILITDTTGRITADEVFIGPTGAAFITRVIAIGANQNRSKFSVSWREHFSPSSLLFPMAAQESVARDPGYFFGDVGGFTLVDDEP